MSLFHLLVFMAVAAIIGGIAQSIVGYSHGGCLISAVLGFIGAILGTWLAGILHAPELWVIQIGDQEVPVIWSIIGATLFVGILQFMVRRGDRGRGL